MTASGYGAADRVPLAGGTMTGTLVLGGSPSVQIPAGASAGDVLTSDSLGNATWQSGVGAALSWQSVAAYGAVGNGSTDCTTAFQSALTAAAPSSPSAPSGTVYVPPGAYVTGPLSIPHRVTFRGAGVGATTLICKAASAAGPFITNATHAEMVTVMDMRLQGNPTGQSHTIHGLVFSGNWTTGASDEYNDLRCRALNLHIEYFTGDGVQSAYKHDSMFDNVSVFDCVGNGFNLSNDDYLSNCDAANNGLDGFLCAGNSLLSNCKAWFNGWTNVSTVTSSSTTTGSGFHITAGDGGTFSNCYAQDNGRNGFYFDGVANVIALGCTADSNNNNSSALTFAGFEFANYSGPALVSGHTWDRGANPVHQASAVRFNPAAPPGGVVLDLTWVPTATMATELSSDTTAANLELNSVRILNSTGIGSTTYGPQTFLGGVAVDTFTASGTAIISGAFTASAGSTLTGTQLLKDATAPASNPTAGVDLYTASATTTPLKIRDVSGNVRSLADGYAIAATTQTTTLTTQQASTQLVIAVEASATYLMDAALLIETPSAINFLHAWTGPTGATMQWGDATDTYVATITGTDTWTGSGAGKMANLQGLLVVSTTAGNLTATFASGTSGQTAQLLAGSWVRLTRVK